MDYLRNVLETSGNYTVKMASTLDFSLISEKIPLGQNITVNGVLSPITNTSKVKLQIFGVNYNKTLNCVIMPDGSFEASFQPPNSGNYSIAATSPETQVSFRADSVELFFSVAEPPLYIKYSIPIIGVLVALSVCGGLLYFFKFRRR
jgi:hypothetical protein